MKIRTEKLIDVQEWDALVTETYGRPYKFQQQDGCKGRGTVPLTVPSDEFDDFEEATVPEEVNHPEMGVSFAAWLARDPKQPIKGDDDSNSPVDSWETRMWWERNFYPDIQMIANDLHAKGLLEAGDYLINIDW